MSVRIATVAVAALAGFSLAHAQSAAPLHPVVFMPAEYSKCVLRWVHPMNQPFRASVPSWAEDCVGLPAVGSWSPWDNGFEPALWKNCAEHPGSLEVVENRVSKNFEAGPKEYADNRGVCMWSLSCNTKSECVAEQSPHRQLRSEFGVCLDVDQPNATQPGARVQGWACNLSTQQRWTFDGRRLTNGYGLCLSRGKHSANPVSLDFSVSMEPCTDDLSQQWDLVNNTVRSRVSIAGENCLAIGSRDGGANGARLTVGRCGPVGTKTQTWYYTVQEK